MGAAQGEPAGRPRSRRAVFVCAVGVVGGGGGGSDALDVVIAVIVVVILFVVPKLRKR